MYVLNLNMDVYYVLTVQTDSSDRTFQFLDFDTGVTVRCTINALIYKRLFITYYLQFTIDYWCIPAVVQ